MDSERLSRALRGFERSVNFIEQILNRPLGEFLNDDEAVHALRYAVIEAVEAAVQIGLILPREPARAASARYSKCSARGESSRGISPRPCGGSQGLGTSSFTAREVDDARLYRELKEEGLKTLRRFLRHVH